MTWLGEPPRWGWLIVGPLLLVGYAFAFALLPFWKGNR